MGGKDQGGGNLKPNNFTNLAIALWLISLFQELDMHSISFHYSTAWYKISSKYVKKIIVQGHSSSTYPLKSFTEFHKSDFIFGLRKSNKIAGLFQYTPVLLKVFFSNFPLARVQVKKQKNSFRFDLRTLALQNPLVQNFIKFRQISFL